MLRTTALASALLAVQVLTSCGAGPAPATPAAPSVLDPTSVTASPAPSAPDVPGDEVMVGQLFMTHVYGSYATSATAEQRQANVALYGEPTADAVVRRWHLGGVILLDRNTLDPVRPGLSTGNVGSAAQLTELTAGLQASALADTGLPLLVATDQEGGRVQRIRDGVTPRPAQRELAGQDLREVTCGYYRLGEELRTLGVNQDLAPDADVASATGGVIGDRSFGPDPARTARLTVAAVEGLQAAGVLATLKHWPGHGSVSTDSHEALAVVTGSAARWRAQDLPPFAAAADSAAAVMVGHLALPALDPSGTAATFSPRLVTGLLREELGFDGLVMTDSLWMQPARERGTSADAALQALHAGADVLLMTPDLPQAYAAVLRAVRTDPVVREQVQRAHRHVLAAKARLGQREDLGC